MGLSVRWSVNPRLPLTHSSHPSPSSLLLTYLLPLSSEDFESPVRDIARKFFPDKLYPQDLPPVHIMSGVDGKEGRREGGREGRRSHSRCSALGCQAPVCLCRECRYGRNGGTEGGEDDTPVIILTYSSFPF